MFNWAGEVVVIEAAGWIVLVFVNTRLPHAEVDKRPRRPVCPFAAGRPLAGWDMHLLRTQAKFGASRSWPMEQVRRPCTKKPRSHLKDMQEPEIGEGRLPG